MKVHINVFSYGVGYSGWDLDLGLTVLPKNKIKKILANSMDKWFVKGKNVYVKTPGSGNKEGSWIVRIFFD